MQRSLAAAALEVVGDDLLVHLRVQARSSQRRLAIERSGTLKLYLTAAPVDGQANKQARETLARTFGVASGQVTLKAGARSRMKHFRITGNWRIPPEFSGAAE